MTAEEFSHSRFSRFRPFALSRPWKLRSLTAVLLAAIACLAGLAGGGRRGASAAPPPTSFDCRWTERPIRIDGKADEGSWKAARPIDRFSLPWVGKDARPARAVVPVPELHHGYLVEVDAIAAR